MLAIGKAVERYVSRRRMEMRADLLGQRRVGTAGEDFELSQDAGDYSD